MRSVHLSQDKMRNICRNGESNRKHMKEGRRPVAKREQMVERGGEKHRVISLRPK